MSPRLLPFAGISSFGIAFLRSGSGTDYALAFWLVLFSQYAIFCLRSFDRRHLFLVPVLGVGVYAAGKFWLEGGPATQASPRGNAGGCSRDGLGAAGNGGSSTFGGLRGSGCHRGHHGSLPGESGEHARCSDHFPQAPSPVLCRAQRSSFPIAATPGELYRQICPLPLSARTLLFYGRLRQLSDFLLRLLRTPANAPGWLVPLGYGEPTGLSWGLRSAVPLGKL